MTLFEHQISGAEWLAKRRRGYLGDEPGTGKTRTFAHALKLVRAQRPVVVCPAIVRSHWLRECDALNAPVPSVFSHQEVSLGGDAVRLALGLADVIIVDEAHEYRGIEAERTKAMFGKQGYARRAKIVWLASGTPIVKNAANIWPILATCFPRIAANHGLYKYADFVDRFCYVTRSWFRGEWRDKILPELKNADQFQNILRDIMLRRTAAEVGLDVPAIFWQPLVLDSTTCGDLARDWSADALIEQYADETDPDVAVWRRQIGEDKVHPVAALLASQLRDSNEKVCVFAYHRSVLALLKDRLAEFGVAYIDGDTSQAKRDAEVTRFASDKQTRVFIGQNQACGTGTDGLQKSGCTRMLMVEPDWTAENNLQLAKRLARVGQASDRVIAQMVTLAGTLDEAIVSRNLRETRMLQQAGLRTEA